METVKKAFYTTRDYKKGDFRDVLSVWERTGMGNPVRGDDEATILQSIKIGGKFLVLEESESEMLIGTSWMTFDGRRIHMHHFGIIPELQGRGLANILLRESLRWVKNKGYQVKLEVHNSNTRAISLYKKYGFEYLGDYDVYIIRDLKKLESEK